MELNFGARIVQASLICSGAFFKGPVVPDANGNFVLSRTSRLGGTASLDLEVQGRIVGDQILATVIITTPAGSSTDQRTLTRGTRADFSDFACALAEP